MTLASSSSTALQASASAPSTDRLPISPGLPFTDTVGAWVPHGAFTIAPTATGALDGLRFAVKDLYDIVGLTTGAGNPDWLATHGPATSTSPVVTALLAAGATLVGKTITDEIAYSIQGDNVHYGTPRNTRAPDRVPGGSSSGSASAAAAGLCDFALGTDTGGSTRVPASYCGLWGLRTTHGLVSTEAMAPLAPKYDTATWLAQDAAVFAQVGDVLLPDTAVSFDRVLTFADTWEAAEPAFRAPLERVTTALAAVLSTTAPRAVQHVRVADAGLEAWRQIYVTASAYDAWETHGDWISATQPRFGAAVDGRFKTASAITAAQAEAAFASQAAIRAQVRDVLGTGGVAVLPSASSAAIPRDASGEAVDVVRANTFRITCIAGLAGLPQVSLPFIGEDGLPLGISLMGPAGSDRALIHLAVAIGRQLGCLGTVAE